MINDEFFRGLDEMTTSDVTQVKCYRCDALMSEQIIVGGNGYRKPEPPPKGCEFVLCAHCQREFCFAHVYRDKKFMSAVNDEDKEPPMCDCKDCKKQFNL